MKRPSILPQVSLPRPGFDILTILCAALIAVHAAIVMQGGVNEMGAGGFYEIVGLSYPEIMKGKLWQVFSYAFFHGSWFHLLLNVLVIYMIGGRVMHILGARAFAKIFFVGVLVGGMLHLLFYPRYPVGEDFSAAYIPLVGASGGLMALLMVITSLSPDSRMWPIMVSGRNLGRGLLLSTLILFLLTPGLKIPILSGMGKWLVQAGDLGVIFQISHICHFGGGVVGILYARRLLRSPVSLEDLRRARKRREGVAA